MVSGSDRVVIVSKGEKILVPFLNECPVVIDSEGIEFLRKETCGSKLCRSKVSHSFSLFSLSLSRDLIINRANVSMDLVSMWFIVVRKIHGSVSRVELNFDSSKGRDFREFRFLDFIPKARFPFDFNWFCLMAKSLFAEDIKKLLALGRMR